MTKSVKRVFLVRHGESLSNVDKSVHLTMADHAIPLSGTGLTQALAAAGEIKEYLDGLHEVRQAERDMWTASNAPRVMWRAPLPLKVVKEKVRLWVSPYKRTRMTADAIEEVVGDWILDRREHILLCEQQFGLFDGIPDEKLSELFPAEQAHYKKCEEFEGRFWARMPLGESRFDVASRVHQSFGTFHRDAEKHGIENIIVVCHGVTLRAFVMMWRHLTPEWFEAEPNPNNCAVRLIEDGEDKGYIFDGFPRQEER